MKSLRVAFFVFTLILLGASVAPAQSIIQVNEFNGTYGQYSDLFIVKLTVDGNAGGSRGSSLTSALPHAPIYWDFTLPKNNGEVMVTANAIPGYKIGAPIFVPYDPSGAFCYLVFDPATKREVDLLVTEDASGAHCSMS